MEVSKKTQQRLFWLLLSGAILCLACSVALIMNHIAIRIQAINAVNQAAHEKLTVSVERIQKHFQEPIDTARQLAHEINSKKRSKEELIALIKAKFEQHPTFHALGVAYEPYTYEKNSKQFAPFFMRIKNQIEFNPIKENYNDKQAAHLKGERIEWYTEAIEKGERWTEPFWGTTSNDNIIVYSVPIYNPITKGKKAIGVVSVTYTLEFLRQLVNALELGNAGYGFVISHKGTIATHPVEKYYRQEKTLFQVAKELKSKELENLGTTIINQKYGAMDYKSPFTEEKTTVLFKDIPGTNLILSLLFIRDEVLSSFQNPFRRSLIEITFVTILFLILLCSLLFKIYLGRPTKKLIAFSIASACLFSAGVTILWNIVYHYPLESGGEHSHPIFGQNTINKTLTRLGKEKTKKQDTITPVEIGILLKNIAITTSNEATVWGYIWGRFPLEHPEIIKDMSLPAAVSRLSRTKIFHKKNNTVEIVIWQFSGTLSQPHFIAQTFPLDINEVRIEVGYPGFNENVIFVPDLDAYERINPTALPGLTHGIVIPEWNIKKSYFTYQEHDLKANFGIKSLAREHKEITLCYNIALERSLKKPLISYLIPLLVALILLFVNLLLISRKTLILHISLTSGVFAGVIFAHTSIRATIPTGGICYLEYFYIALYLFIVLLLFNFFLYAQETTTTIITYRNNIITKMLFWPAFLGIIFLITALVFF